MSIQTQAIIPSLSNGSDLLGTIRAKWGGTAIVRPMHRDDYDIVELQTEDGVVIAIHVFGPSYVKEDYPKLFANPSVLLSAEFSQTNARILRELAQAWAGFFRRTDQEKWEKL